MKRMILTVVFGFSASLAQADIRAVLVDQDDETPDATSILYYRDDNHIRIESGDDLQSYSLISDDKHYHVVEMEGAVYATDVKEMVKGLSQLAAAMEEDDEDMAQSSEALPDDFSMRPTGKTVTVAGIKGQEFRVTGEGEEFTYILTDNDDAVTVTRAYFESVTNLMEDEEPMFRELIQRIESTGYPGILSMDGFFEIKELTHVDKPAGFYRLPENAQVVSSPTGR